MKDMFSRSKCKVLHLIGVKVEDITGWGITWNGSVLFPCPELLETSWTTQHLPYVVDMTDSALGPGDRLDCSTGFSQPYDRLKIRFTKKG